jgi:stalled ribosome rescue protein Dom34
MRQIGIWMDMRKAYVLTIYNHKERLKKIVSNIESFHVHGGSGTRIKGGPQDVVQDSKYLEREKHQFNEYSKAIASEIKKGDSIVIYGPAEAGMRFNKILGEKYKEIAKNVTEVLKADSMTDNQISALLRDYFKK